jgi:hypothetical protein
MKLKVYLIALISAFAISFPQNIIGCGGGDLDPYDYFISFYNPDITEAKNYKQFYYTSVNHIYEEADVAELADIVADEWQAYCGANVNAKDAKTFVFKADPLDVNNLYFHLEKNKPLAIPDSLKRNSMVKYFMQNKDLEALGYILYAKKNEMAIPTAEDYWQPVKADTSLIRKYVKNGIQLYNASKKDFFKLKYAYQITKLSLYGKNAADVIKYYDEYVANTTTESILRPMALALKAGGLFRQNKKAEAAYIYSKVFNQTDARKLSNYLSFKWCFNDALDITQAEAFCKTDKEKADLYCLQALTNASKGTESLEKIVAFNPNHSSFQTIVAREINRLESFYFSQQLAKMPGGSGYFYSDNSQGENKKEGSEAMQALISILKNAALKTNASFCNSAIAHTYLMQNKFDETQKYLALAKKGKLTQKVEEQWNLTNLLYQINKADKITEATEAEILPMLQWLEKRAKQHLKKDNDNWYQPNSWQNFYRNILNVALAKKYKAQGNIYKEAMCVGKAYTIYGEQNNYYNNGLELLRNKTDITDVEKLYATYNADNNSPFIKYLIAGNHINIKDIIDFAGTGYLRNNDYKNAITWFNKAGANASIVINKSAFLELLYDKEEALPTEKRKTSKLEFAKEMLEAEEGVTKDPTKAAKYYYKLATGMYNMTYYGHAWELVQYYRSGSDGYVLPPNPTNFEREYYGCYKALAMYKKALDASTDNNFKAKCLYMMAKCEQKDIGNQLKAANPNFNEWDLRYNGFYKPALKNKYFPQLLKFKNTKFYEEAYNSCSYLRDFEMGKK